jgi:hypothetical protein
MMRRIAVRLASAGTGGEAKEIGEIDDTGIAWGNSRGQLRGEAGQQLIALLGAGYMESRFELIVGKQGLGGCEVSKVGRVLDFTYVSTFLARE